MKFLNLTNFFRVSMLALVMTCSAASVSAATTVDTRPSTTVDRDRDNYTGRTDRDHSSDWGWIGLLGLLGLAGLLPKTRTHDNDRHDRNDRNDTTNRNVNR